MPDDGAASPHSVAAFFDKHTVPPRAFSLRDGVRIVPGGTAIRRGQFPRGASR